MKALLIFTFVSLILTPLSAFTIVSDEMIKEREILCENIRRIYSEARMSAFVRKVQSENPKVEGVEISSAPVSEKWTTLDWNPFWYLGSGAWAMKVESDKSEDSDFSKFTFMWAHTQDSAILMHGHRTAEGILILDSIVKEDISAINWL